MATALLVASTYDRSNDVNAGAQTRKGGVHIAAIGGTIALDATYPNVCKFDPTGANRDVTLDLIANCPGLERKIINSADAAENLVVKLHATDGGTTVATINQNEEGDFYNDGAAWNLVVIRTIALS